LGLFWGSDEGAPALSLSLSCFFFIVSSRLSSPLLIHPIVPP